MKNLIKEQELKLKNILQDLGYETEHVTINISSRPDLGQYQFNDAMSLAKKYGKNPRIIAEEIVNELKKNPVWSEVSIAGPGFINLTFNNDVLLDFVNNDILAPIVNNNPKTIVVDYGGANVAKALHVGHLRAANIGEAIKRLLKYYGHKVIGDAHLGDWGLPMGQVILELKHRYPDSKYFDENHVGEYPEDIKITNADLEEIYPIAAMKTKEDKDFYKEAKDITAKLQAGHPGYTALWKYFVKLSVDNIKYLYDKLNVDFELWYGESDAKPYVEPSIELMKNQDLAKMSEGALIIEVKTPEDNKPMPPVMLKKSDGSDGYHVTDVATIYGRMEENNPDEIWYIVDKRQNLHFEQIFRAVRKSNIVPEDIKLIHVGYGTINGPDGKPFKTRDGDAMSLLGMMDMIKTEAISKVVDHIPEKEKEVVADMVAMAALKYADIVPNVMTDYICDPAMFTEMTGKTGPYLQYTIVRINSLLEKAKDKDLKIGPITKINNNLELNVLLNIINTPIAMNKSLEAKSLNEIADHLYNLANAYNNFYANSRILEEADIELRTSWLGLSKLVSDTMLMLLNILAIDVPDRM